MNCFLVCAKDRLSHFLRLFLGCLSATIYGKGSLFGGKTSMANNSIDKKFRIFVSSVGVMMSVERKTLRELIWKSGHIPIAMEGFSGNHQQTSIEVVKENLDHADVVIFVLGFTYGSIIGDGLKCKECPIKSSCGAKRKKVGNCVISYTHFEYLYAKQKGILAYCIIQKDIQSADAFNKRLDAFIRERQNTDSNSSQIRSELSAEYYKKQDIYDTLITKAKKKWAYFYDANSDKGISAYITSVFSEISNRLIIDGENVFGLIDGNQFRLELIEKNRQIVDLEREVNKLNREMVTALSQAYQLINWPSTAVTGTCIPFLYDKKEGMIITYLVCNSAYCKGSRLMFPGGHAFTNDDSPEAIAIIKAKTEAGLDVRPIDLHSSFDAKSERFSKSFCVCRSPHFSYLFEQDPSAKCYREKNHLHHYDAVYVCEIFDIHPEAECSQERVVVKLPSRSLTMIQVKKCLECSIEEFNQQNRENVSERETFGDYIVKMLFDAHRDYISYLKQLDREERNNGTT